MTLRCLGAPIKNVYYWRDKSQNEIDFVLEGVGLVPNLYECKWAYETIKADALESFRTIHGKIGGLVVVSFNPKIDGFGVLGRVYGKSYLFKKWQWDILYILNNR